MTNVQIAEDMPDLDAAPAAHDSAAIIGDAVVVIDAALSQMVKRELVSSSEVSDLLLDVRNLLIRQR